MYPQALFSHRSLSPAPSTTTSLLVHDLVAAAHMASDGAAATPAKVTPKKANLLDPYSIKHLLDETISDVLCFTLNPSPLLPLLPPFSIAPPTWFL